MERNDGTEAVGVLSNQMEVGDREKMGQDCCIVMNGMETLLLTPCGDVLVSRCRAASKSLLPPPPPQNIFPSDPQVQQQQQSSWCASFEEALCGSAYALPSYPTGSDIVRRRQQGPKDGLLGGRQLGASANPSNNATRRPSLQSTSDDSSHFPKLWTAPFWGSTPAPQQQSPQEEQSPFQWRRKRKPPLSHPSHVALHGVPVFLSSLHRVQIEQISAHPMGSHVLLISSQAMLYSYGKNDHGQLGYNVTTNYDNSPATECTMTPTIVTSLLEHGGKAVQCAAGVRHSLVVIQQERRRTATSSSVGQQEVQQLIYGFGDNDCMKLGLQHPPMENVFDRVVTPRRVALQLDDESSIVSIHASQHHSAALIQQGDKNVLYTWGDVSHGALGIPTWEEPTTAPKVVAIPAPVETIPLLPNEQPASVALGPTVTFVVTNFGRGFVFGTGLLGSDVGEPIFIQPKLLQIEGKLCQVSVGTTHVLARTDEGAVLAWGDTRTETIMATPEQVTTIPPMAHVCAGPDSISFLVTQDGYVWSGGDIVTGGGRIAHGEAEAAKNSEEPCPVFGGLRLWVS